MDIYMELDHIIGDIRDGHFEGEIDFSEKEEEDFQTLLKKDLNDEELTDEEIDRLDEYKEEIIDHCKFVIDWYEIEETGFYHWEDCLD